jgi:CRISPR/Cas system Type II protein with McrA/HNH and RuvC-like nuclease domain
MMELMRKSSQARNEQNAQRERLQKALQSLGETLTDLSKTIESKKGERCPYRSAKDECTYRGGCINKRRQADGTKLCGGDHKLKWK